MTMLELPKIMNTSSIKDHGTSSTESIIQRLKHQVCVIKMLEDRDNDAFKKNAAIRDKIRHVSSESDRLVSILKAKADKNEKELKLFLSPPVRRAITAVVDRDAASPCLLATPFNPSIPPPLQNAAPSSIRCLLGVKRVFGNSIDLCAASASPPPTLSSSSPSGTASSDTIGFTRTPLDPSIDLILNRFRRSVQTSETQISTNQAELQRSKFTQDSQNGKRIMSRVRVLEAENEELERQKESGRPAKVTSLITLRQHFINTIKRTNENIERLVDEAESETEVFTSTLIMLQEQLSIARTTIEVLAVALEAISAQSGGHSRCASLFAKANWPLPDSLAHLADLQSSPSPQSAAIEEADAPPLEVSPPKITKLESLPNALSEKKEEEEKVLSPELSPMKVAKIEPSQNEDENQLRQPSCSPEVQNLPLPCSSLPLPPSMPTSSAASSTLHRRCPISRDPRILRYRT